jgi:predicted phosphodiesterase
MQITLISDMHGNCVALDAVLADLRRYPATPLVCLGDAIQGGPQPAQVVARLRELACPVVMGNADAWLLTGQETGSEAISAEQQVKMDAVRVWSLAQLSEADQAFIAGFQPVVRVGTEAGQRLLCFHGSPASFDDVLLPTTPEDEFRRLLGGQAAEFFTGGHTHLQQLRRLGQGFFFNPGSVGRAFDHEQDEAHFRADPWAEYAVLTLEPGRPGLEFRRAPFEASALIHAYRTSGRPYAEEAAAQYALA